MCAAVFSAAFIFSCASVAPVPLAAKPNSSFLLHLRDDKTGVVYASFPLPSSAAFSVSFKHSVNRSDVEEGYRFYDGSIFLDWCLYSSFGAGVPDVLEAEQRLSYTDDNRMLVSGFNRRIPVLRYEISTVYDHFLHINGTKINLTELGLKGKRIDFAVVQAQAAASFLR